MKLNKIFNKAFITIITLVGLTSLALTACNYEPIEFHYNYDYAIIKLQNGEIVEGKVESWTDYEGEQLQVKVNGKTYLTNSFNCTLISEG